MWKHNQEAIEAVEEFNERVISIIGNDREFSPDHMMNMETDGTQTVITFMGVHLWNSEDDGRGYDKEGEPNGTLLGFLEKRAREELERFSRVLLPKPIEKSPVTKPVKGMFVHYTPASGFGNPENGRIKSFNDTTIFVVYKCNNEWSRYEEYTGQATDLGNLSEGWYDKDGNPIDIPEEGGTYL